MTDAQPSCEFCGAPQRSLHVYGRAPALEELETGDWLTLDACPECSQLWVEVPYEPYAAFTFWAAWPGTEDQFWRLHEIEQAQPIHEWHKAVIRQQGPQLEGEDLEAIEKWRDRTSRNHNPIDRPDFEERCEYVCVPEDLVELLEE